MPWKYIPDEDLGVEHAVLSSLLPGPTRKVSSGWAHFDTFRAGLIYDSGEWAIYNTNEPGRGSSHASFSDLIDMISSDEWRDKYGLERVKK